MKMTRSTAVRHPRRSTTDAAEMHSTRSVASDEPARWQTRPGCTLCPYPSQFLASMAAEPVKLHLQQDLLAKYQRTVT